MAVASGHDGTISRPASPEPAVATLQKVQPAAQGTGHEACQGRGDAKGSGFWSAGQGGRDCQIPGARPAGTACRACPISSLGRNGGAGIDGSTDKTNQGGCAVAIFGRGSRSCPAAYPGGSLARTDCPLAGSASSCARDSGGFDNSGRASPGGSRGVDSGDRSCPVFGRSGRHGSFAG